MGRITSTVLLLFFSLSILKAQGRRGSIKRTIADAASVWFISHEVTSIFIKYEQGPSTERKLFQNGNLNMAIIKEAVLLYDADKERLATILARPFEDKFVESAKCFLRIMQSFGRKGKGYFGSTSAFLVIHFDSQMMWSRAWQDLTRGNGRNSRSFSRRKD